MLLSYNSPSPPLIVDAYLDLPLNFLSRWPRIAGMFSSPISPLLLTAVDKFAATASRSHNTNKGKFHFPFVPTGLNSPQTCQFKPLNSTLQYFSPRSFLNSKSRYVKMRILVQDSNPSFRKFGISGYRVRRSCALPPNKLNFFRA